MIEKDIKFKFKGSRTYIHGTDIYNFLIKFFDDNISKIDLSFHSISNKNITLLSSISDNDELNFVFKYVDSNLEQKVIYAVENNSLIEEQYDYNEDLIYENSQLYLDEEKVSLSKNTGFTFIENIVAMNKYLLENLFEKDGKWYFTRLQLNKPILDLEGKIEIKLKSNFNFKLTKSEIYADEKVVGYIYFSLV